MFPGQGAQVVGMGRDVRELSPAARTVFEEANRVLDFDLADLCFNGPEERLSATDVSQPAIFVTSVAYWRALKENPATADAVQPQATLGLSLGEYTALWLSGSLSFADALRLVHRRGQLMQEAADARPGGMVSVMGLQPGQIDEVCRDAAGADTLSPANFNAPGQVVLSGDRAACDRVPAIVDSMGGRAIVLRVAGAFHSPLMQPAADRLGPVLAGTTLNPTGIPVVSNVSADYHDTADEIRRLLEVQVARPIRWQASVERLIADGFDRFVEIGPGRVLTGLMRGINRSVQAVNVSSLQAIEKLKT